MTTDEELRTVADALGRDIVVIGTSDLAPAVGDPARPSDGGGSPEMAPGPDEGTVMAPDSDAVRTAQAVVVAVDHTTAEPGPDSALARIAGDAQAFVVAVLGVPADGGSVDPSLLAAVRDTVDATLLVSRRHPVGAPAAGDDPAPDDRAAEPPDGRSPGTDPTVQGAFEFVRLLRETGFVNLDLADARTVLGCGPLAGLGHGAAALTDPDAHEAAVARAFDAMPTGVDPARSPGALVSIVGGPTMSITDVSAALSAVRERVGAGAHVIWGGAVDEGVTGDVHVRVVVADVAYAPTPAPGDPCPRCGATVSTYAFGETTTHSCDGCGFADVAISFE